MGKSQGKFVWHDLMTTDPAAARRFYSELFGWKIEDVDMGKMGKYAMIKMGDKGLGGIVPFDAKAGVPSHWIGYLTVANLDESLQKATAAGAKVHHPADDIPNVGRFAVLEDPQGAIVAPFQGAGEPPPETEGVPPVGHFCWDELHTSDPEAAARFYTGLLGWTTEVLEMPPSGKYWMYKREAKNAAGMTRAQPGQSRPAWLSYVTVADTDATAARAGRLGAKVLMAPADIPGMGRFAVLADPTGAVIALWRPQA